MKACSLTLILPLAAAFSFVSPGIVHAQRPDVEPIPVCIYGGQSFSEGAQICMQRAQMLTCTASGPKAVWTVVTDQALNARCLVAFGFERPAAPAAMRPAIAWRARPRADFPPVPPMSSGPEPSVTSRAEPPSTNCFTFNNRRFCE